MKTDNALKKNRSEVFLIMPKLQPSLLTINPNDGAKYIESGRILFEWGLRNLAWVPLVALIYVPIYLIVGNSPNWFMPEVWNGNYILFGLLWLSFYTLAHQLDKYISKYVIIGLLFVSTVYFPILENQSDALFIPLSTMALLFLIRFLETDKLKNLWLAFLFVSLGVLCRFEAILLVITLTGFALGYGLKKHKVVKLLLAAWVPVAALQETSNVLTPYNTVAIAGKINPFLLPSTISTPEQLLLFLGEGNFQGVYIRRQDEIPF